MSLVVQLPFKHVSTGIGEYWTCRQKTAAIREWMRDASLSRWKEASIGGEQEQGFEQAFSSLAYSYLKDKAPRLLDFIIGFQLVDRNEDNTKAMGIFGFKVGDQWLYAPCFFLNGDLKGHELLYVKKQDSFVPLKENWVNHLISRRPHVLGEGSEKQPGQLGSIMPNLRRFSGPPTSGAKYSSEQTTWRPKIAGWAAPFIAFIGAAASNDPAVFAKHANLGKKLDLSLFLTDIGLLKTAFDKMYSEYPLIKEGFDKFYGSDFFEKQALAIQDRLNSTTIDLEKAAQSFILPPKKKKANKYLLPEEEPEPHPIKSGALRIFYRDLELQKASSEKVDEHALGGITENKPELDTAERERLLNDGILIKDTRKAEQISIAYNTQKEIKLENPTETGIYSVLEKPGTFSEMIVISFPYSNKGRNTFATVLRKDSPKDWLNTHGTKIWVERSEQQSPGEWTKFVDSLSDSTSLTVGATYVAVSHGGAGTTPFEIEESYGDGSYRVSWDDYGGSRPANLPRVRKRNESFSGYGTCNIRINTRKGTKIRMNGNELSIPSDFKFIKVSDPPKKEDELDLLSCFCSGESSRQSGSEKKPIQPGSLIDIQLGIQKQASISVQALGGNELVVKSRLGSHRLNKQACLVSLVFTHGLAQEAANEIIKEAEHLAVTNRAARYTMKYANGYALEGGPGAPAFPGTDFESEQYGPTSATTQYLQEEELPIDEMSAQRTDPSTYDPFYQPDPQAMQQAQQAAASGQKDVFDTSMISGMLKSVRQQSLVDRYLGDLIKGVDKLGRILFMLFWHSEEFEERYGKSELPELEDSARNSFESLGDLVLFLMEKTTNGTAGMQLAGVGGASAEPNIDESARN